MVFIAKTRMAYGYGSNMRYVGRCTYTEIYANSREEAMVEARKLITGGLSAGVVLQSLRKVS